MPSARCVVYMHSVVSIVMSFLGDSCLFRIPTLFMTDVSEKLRRSLVFPFSFGNKNSKVKPKAAEELRRHLASIQHARNTDSL